MRNCVCGFVPPLGVAPSSPEYHRAHRDAHLARYPLLDAASVENLNTLVEMAERKQMRDVGFDADLVTYTERGDGCYRTDEEQAEHERAVARRVAETDVAIAAWGTN